MTERFICVHGHFYQPPRENPWTGRIDQQPSAAPFHDWNERINRECYEANAFARLLLGESKVERLINNYSRMSFNFGPTLLSWIQVHSPSTYAALQEADRVSSQRFSGHGSAIAQAFNHIILPLANARDKRTQVRWGLRDFELRFGRKAEGMWLPECAVDLDTLTVLAEEGVLFTILSPNQAAGDLVDPRKPYRVELADGKSIAVFFYDGTLAQDIAFKGILDDGRKLADKLRGSFSDDPAPQLVHVATDGESYGHHHHFGEMALAYALEALGEDPRVRLTNYGEYLERHPPSETIRIKEPSSWSCAHGVGRWNSDCGCTTGSGGGFDQKWRAPLRKALDLLRDQAAAAYEREASGLITDPWALRDASFGVLFMGEDPADFIRSRAARDLTPDERRKVLSLLELQRYTQLMYTSCGWFFDDISRIETVQILRYAARVIEFGRELGGQDWEPAFLKILSKARSNVAEHGDGAKIYAKIVAESSVSL